MRPCFVSASFFPLSEPDEELATRGTNAKFFIFLGGGEDGIAGNEGIGGRGGVCGGLGIWCRDGGEELRPALLRAADPWMAHRSERAVPESALSMRQRHAS